MATDAVFDYVVVGSGAVGARDGWLSTSMSDARLGLRDRMLTRTVIGAARSELRRALGTGQLTRFQDVHRYLRMWLDPNDVRLNKHGLEGALADATSDRTRTAKRYA